MSLATKQRIIAQPWHATRRYILSTMPVLWISGRRDSGGTNQFISDDAYGHLCTVTGALWRQNGRTFNGTSDKIQVTNSLLSGTKNVSQKTIMGWWYVPNSTGYGQIMAVRNSGGANWQLYRITGGLDLGYGDGDTWPTLVTSYFTVGTWVHIAITIDGLGNAVTPFKNGEKLSSTAINFGTTNGGNVFNLGTDNTGTPAYGNGTCGEFRMYNRLFVDAEIQQDYLATKWRY